MNCKLRWLAVLGICFYLAAGPACRPSGPRETAAGPIPQAKDYEAISLFGDKLVSPVPDPAVLARLDDARKAYESDPSEDNAVWLGRRAAYAGRYREAIGIYTENLARFPQSYKLLRHRGHRYISIRQFGRAVADFEKAAELVRGRPAEIEPDGLPGPPGSSPSPVQFAVFYHLGLARYLSGDFAGAESAYMECLAWSTNDDRLVATTDWLYLTLRKLGKEAEARAVLDPIRPEMNVSENGNYHVRLLMYKGLASPESLLAPRDGKSEADRLTRFAIQAYGVGQARLWAGDQPGAIRIFRELLKAPNWSAFGYIAAEADLARILQADPAKTSAEEALRSWTLMWNTYDLGMLDPLFLQDDRPTYFSSEKAGLIRGFPSLAEHHRGFGFVPGGKSQDNRLWLEDVNLQTLSGTAVATARWLFDRDVGGADPVDRGPATFVLFSDGAEFRIVHAHFADDPVTPPVTGR